MVLVDTSVWIDFLRSGDTRLARFLEGGRVYMHPMVLGELACGHLKHRSQLLALWKELPLVPLATDAEALYLLEQHRLMGRGIGYVDLHLLASSALSQGIALWTRDRRLREAASELGVGFAHS